MGIELVAWRAALLAAADGATMTSTLIAAS
jgi:hypothetical protein